MPVCLTLFTKQQIWESEWCNAIQEEKNFNLFAKMNLKNGASAEWKIYMKNV